MTKFDLFVIDHYQPDNDNNSQGHLSYHSGLNPHWSKASALGIWFLNRMWRLVWSKCRGWKGRQNIWYSNSIFGTKKLEYIIYLLIYLFISKYYFFVFFPSSFLFACLLISSFLFDLFRSSLHRRFKFDGICFLLFIYYYFFLSCKWCFNERWKFVKRVYLCSLC